MSEAPVLSQGAAKASVQRESIHTTTTAYYVTRTTHKPPALKGTPQTRAAAIQAFRGKEHRLPDGPSATYSTDHDLAAKGAMASLRHPPDTQYDMTTEKLISEDGVGLSRAGSMAALRSARGRSGTLDSRETILEETLGQNQSSRQAATGAMATSHKRLRSASIQEELPDLTQAMSAATTSQRVVREDQNLVEAVEPTYDPAKLHQVAVARTQSSMAGAYPSGGTQDEATRKNTQQAAAVTMAKQMYAILPQAREMAAAETGDYPIPRDRAVTGLEPDGAPINLLSVAQKRVTARLAQMDAEQAPMRMYRSPRASRPASITSPMIRRSSTSSDAETSSFTRLEPRRTQFRTTMRDRTNRVSSPVEEDPLMAMARRNADITMNNIDQDVYMRSGRPPPAVLRGWERKVNERAMAVKAPPTSTFVPMEGSRFEDNPHVQAIARSRLQPRLAEIDDRVNKRRASVLEKKLDKEHERRYQKLRKERDTETMKANTKILKWLKMESRRDIKAQKKQEKKEAKERARAEKAQAKKDKKAEKKRGQFAVVNGTTAERESPPLSRAEPERDHESLRAGEEEAAGPVRKEETDRFAASAAQPNGTAAAATPEAGPERAPSEPTEPEPEPTPQPVPVAVPVVPVVPVAAPVAVPAETLPQAPSPALPGTTDQWSTSNEGEEGGSVLVEPAEPTPAVPKRSPKRFWGMFGRSSPRDTGKQGSFEVQKRTAARDTVENGSSDAGPSVQPETSQSEPQPGVIPRSSKFQEIL